MLAFFAPFHYIVMNYIFFLLTIDNVIIITVNINYYNILLCSCSVKSKNDYSCCELFRFSEQKSPTDESIHPPLQIRERRVCRKFMKQ